MIDYEKYYAQLHEEGSYVEGVDDEDDEDGFVEVESTITMVEETTRYSVYDVSISICKL